MSRRGQWKPHSRANSRTLGARGSQWWHVVETQRRRARMLLVGLQDETGRENHKHSGFLCRPVRTRRGVDMTEFGGSPRCASRSIAPARTVRGEVNTTPAQNVHGCITIARHRTLCTGHACMHCLSHKQLEAHTHAPSQVCSHPCSVNTCTRDRRSVVDGRGHKNGRGSRLQSRRCRGRCTAAAAVSRPSTERRHWVH